MKATIDKILETILIIILSIMLLSVLWQVFSRYILQAPSTITAEISSFALIWVGLLGAAYGTGEQVHFAIDLLPEKILAKIRTFYAAVVYLSVFIFALSVML